MLDIANGIVLNIPNSLNTSRLADRIGRMHAEHANVSNLDVRQ